MLENPKITEIAVRVARTKVSAANLERVMTRQATDSQGNEALRITVVLKPGVALKLSGDDALDMLVGIQEQLRAEGEERFPIVEYATEQEIDSEDGQTEIDQDEDEL